MKYICWILVIMLLPFLLLAYNQIQRKPLRDNAAIIVDNTIVSREDFKRYSAADRPPYQKTRQGVIDSIITRKILIAEAQKRGIDRRESFRWAMENYYEQSLVKTLMDDVQDDIVVTVTDREVERFLELLDTTVHYTVFAYDSLSQARRDRHENGTADTITFADLGLEMKTLFLEMTEGETTPPLPRGDGYVVYRLDRIDPGTESSAVRHITGDAARTMLLHQKKQHAIDNWINGLRDKARVQVLIDHR